MNRDQNRPILDERCQSLPARCYAIIDKVPSGRVITYKDLAEAVGTKGYRAVGNIVGRNPNPPKTPCHRVVCSDGRLGGYSAKGGLAAKIRLLNAEGVKVEGGRISEFDCIRWRPGEY